LDFDGVLTDNRVIVDQDGREFVMCSRSDGQGIAMLKARGIPVIVISRERNAVVAARCRKLGVDCFSACDDKLGLLRKVADDLDLSPLDVCYVGNDIHDVACLRWVGISVAVADAESAARNAAAFVTTRNGGHGAVREVIDWLLEANVTPHMQARHASADMAG
jgi:YrbI family 3-deoxy-D-manno-octulosonate 8-phosphate phosphatase